MARPDPRGLPVGAHAAPPSGASRVASLSHVHACCRHYPGGITGCSYRSLPQRRRPSPKLRRVGFRIALFEACLAFTTRYGLHVRRVTIMTLYTEGFGRFVTSTTAPIATGWSDRCRVGISPTERTRLSRRTDRCGLDPAGSPCMGIAASSCATGRDGDPAGNYCWGAESSSRSSLLRTRHVAQLRFTSSQYSWSCALSLIHI